MMEGTEMFRQERIIMETIEHFLCKEIKKIKQFNLYIIVC